LLVTDVAARPTKQAVTFAAGRVAAEAIDVRVDDAAWARFEAASDGAADNKRGTDDPQDEIPVTIRKKSVGRAVRQRQGLTTVGRVGLRPGHVLWARTQRSSDGVAITELSFAHTWRHAARGGHPHVSDRIPQGFLPCTGSDGLCPACRVFGSANTRGGRQGEDRPYRGHVRFTDWSVTGDVETVDLAPMGQPRPGSGQLYLQHESQPSGEAARAGIGQDPLREWGSALDQGSPRPIRGRKMYWRAEDAEGRPARYRFHKSHAGKGSAGTMAARAEVVLAGATISGRLVFENLSRGELGAILVALCPDLIKDHQHPGRGGQDGTFCFTLGGGKPLGLGATHVTQVEVTLDQDRYTDRSQAPGSVEGFVGAFVAEQAPEVRAVWADFLELVRLNAVDPALLSYPRDAQWPESGDSADLYAAGFKWWKSSAGMPWDGLGSKRDEEHEVHGYVVMPTATAPDPRVPITIEGVAAPDHVKARLTTPATRGRR
jgi:CRISPR-associated protein (TIGR03986 family)